MVVENNVGSSLVICPTAQHRTKIWPMFKYIEIAQKWSGGVIVLGGPSERLFINQMVDAIGPKARGISELGFTQTILAMNDAKVAIGNDSGLTHLCRAFGIPTLVIMGPTTAQDGWPHASSTAALPLYCRPCSRHGGPECPIGDLPHEELTVSDVWQNGGFNHENAVVSTDFVPMQGGIATWAYDVSMALSCLDMKSLSSPVDQTRNTLFK